MPTAWDSHSASEHPPEGPRKVVSERPSERRAGDLSLTQGQRVDRYVVLYELGQGGMGVVYAAYDPQLDRKIALKVLHPRRAGRQGSTRLIREAKAIAKLSHPHVVGVHDVGTFEDRVFVAMEYVDGVTLRRYLDERRPPWPTIVSILCDAGEALAAAHAMDLVHRDFKPDNVLVDRNGRAVVLDFGLARRAGRGSDEEDERVGSTHSYEFSVDLTRTGAKLGTPAYMAPEQHLGVAVDARADQFAFCVVLWEALYGLRPFGHDPAEVAARTVAGQIADPPKGRKVPAHLRRALTKGLAADPAQRFASMHALLAELRVAPSRRRTIAFGLSGFTLVGALGVGARIFGATEAEPTPCAPEEGDWQPIWNDERKVALRDAFESAARTYGPATARGVVQQIDIYVGRWSTAYGRVCGASTLSTIGATDPAVASKLACLRSRQSEAGMLIGEFSTADAAVVERAIEAASELRSPEECLEVIPGMAVEAEISAETAALWAELRRSEAKERAGRYGDALQLAQRVTALADAKQRPELIAKAQFQLGRILERQGDFRGAEAALLRSVWAASRGRADEIAASAWVRLVWIAGVERVDLVQGELWAQFAEAAIDRIGRPPLLHASWLHNLAGVRYRQTRLHEALSLYERAQALQERLLGPSHPALATTYNHIGNVLIELGRFDAARTSCERSLALRRQLLGDEHPKVAASYNNLAELFRKQGVPDTSLDYARRSLQIVGGSGGPEEVNALLLAAEAHERRVEWDEAAHHYARLVALVQATQPRQAAAGLRALGRVRKLQGDTTAALGHWREAVVLERSTVPEEAVQTLMWMAEIHTEQGAEAAALDVLAEAQELAESAGARALALEVAALRHEHEPSL